MPLQTRVYLLLHFYQCVLFGNSKIIQKYAWLADNTRINLCGQRDEQRTKKNMFSDTNEVRYKRDFHELDKI